MLQSLGKVCQFLLQQETRCSLRQLAADHWAAATNGKLLAADISVVLQNNWTEDLYITLKDTTSSIFLFKPHHNFFLEQKYHCGPMSVQTLLPNASLGSRWELIPGLQCHRPSSYHSATAALATSAQLTSVYAEMTEETVDVVHQPVRSMCRTECIVDVDVAEFWQRSTKFFHFLWISFYLLTINTIISLFY